MRFTILLMQCITIKNKENSFTFLQNCNNTFRGRHFLQRACKIPALCYIEGMSERSERACVESGMQREWRKRS